MAFTKTCTLKYNNKILYINNQEELHNLNIKKENNEFKLSFSFKDETFDFPINMESILTTLVPKKKRKANGWILWKSENIEWIKTKYGEKDITARCAIIWKGLSSEEKNEHYSKIFAIKKGDMISKLFAK